MGIKYDLRNIKIKYKIGKKVSAIYVFSKVQNVNYLDKIFPFC